MSGVRPQPTCARRKRGREEKAPVTERSVLVDTGAWLAAFSRRDQYHAEAAAELRRLRRERVRLVVSDLILAELHLHLVHGLGAARAADHLAALKADPLIGEVFHRAGAAVIGLRRLDPALRRPALHPDRCRELRAHAEPGRVVCIQLRPALLRGRIQDAAHSARAASPATEPDA